MSARPARRRSLGGAPVLRSVIGAAGAAALVALGTGPAAAEGAGDGLALETLASVDGLKPGSSFEVPVTVKNKTNEALPKVWLSYSVSLGLAHTELPSNCLRYDVPPYDEMQPRSVAVCEYEQPVEPGVVYAPEKPLTIDAKDSALQDRVGVSVGNYDLAPSDSGAVPVRGTGPAQKLVEQAATARAADFMWDSVTVPVTADSTADFQVSGARLKARTGDTVTAELSFTNAGPGWVGHEAGTPAHQIIVTLPAGTKAVKIPGLCKATDKPGRYECGSWQSWVNANYKAALPFKLKVDKVVPGAKGTIALVGEPRPFDKNPENDKAAIVIEAKGGGSSTGGSGGSGSATGGSTGGSTTTGGSDSSASGGSSTGGSSSGGSSSSTAGGTGTATTGGNLASTGSGSALPLAGAAAAAVAAGGGIVLLRHRRRQGQ